MQRQCRADSRYAPSQWETALLCNDVSRWLGASLESALQCIMSLPLINFQNKVVYCQLHSCVHWRGKRWVVFALLLARWHADETRNVAKTAMWLLLITNPHGGPGATPIFSFQNPHQRNEGNLSGNDWWKSKRSSSPLTNIRQQLKRMLWIT